MATIGKKLADRLGYSPFLDTVLLQFDQQVLLAIPHILALPLHQVSLTCYYIHGILHPEGQFYPDHLHDDAIEIQYCLEGEYSIETDGQPPLLLTPGSGAVIAPGLAHRSRCIKKGVRLTTRAAISGPEAVEFARELKEQVDGRLLPFDGQHREMVVADIFQTLLDEAPTPWKYEMAGGLIRIWLAAILSTCLDLESRMPSSTDGADGDRGHALCERASAYIYANFQQTINIEAIAQHVGVTARHLNRLFAKHMGTSVGHTLRDVRLSEAYKLLSKTGKPSIKETAYRVGFVSPSYFTQCFKQQYGILPTEVYLKLSLPLADAVKQIESKAVDD